MRQATIAEYIGTHIIFELCNGAELIPGFSQSTKWWYKDHRREEGETESMKGLMAR